MGKQIGTKRFSWNLGHRLLNLENIRAHKYQRFTIMKKNGKICQLNIFIEKLKLKILENLKDVKII
jgi:hypothetical protein